MSDNSEIITDRKLELLTKLNNLQRVVIGIDSKYTDRDVKNLNSTFSSVNVAHSELLKALAP